MDKLLIFFLLLGSYLYANEPISPLPTTVEGLNLQKAELGKLLFFDPILSADKSISCHSCHSFDDGGADPRKVSLGVQDRKGSIQSPTVYNSRYNFRQFWNGRASSLEDQASGPLFTHEEMAMTDTKILQRLNSNAFYQARFKKVYRRPKITIKDTINAIVEFEKALITPNSRFDRYLRGELELTQAEKQGYAAFKSLGCITCHNGINIGANSFQKLGLFKPYPYDPKYQDRYALTNKEYHKNVFKVPTLRNISLTAPYFHDAKAKTLDEAVKLMATHNLGIKLSQKNADSLVSFLKSLEGERPKILDSNAH